MSEKPTLEECFDWAERLYGVVLSLGKQGKWERARSIMVCDIDEKRAMYSTACLFCRRFAPCWGGEGGCTECPVTELCHLEPMYIPGAVLTASLDAARGVELLEWVVAELKRLREIHCPKKGTPTCPHLSSDGTMCCALDQNVADLGKQPKQAAWIHYAYDRTETPWHSLCLSCGQGQAHGESKCIKCRLPFEDEATPVKSLVKRADDC